MSVGNFNFCKFMSFTQLANGLLGFFLINLPVYSGKHTTVLCLENIFFIIRLLMLFIGSFIYWHVESLKFCVVNLSLFSLIDPGICFQF